MNLNKKKHRGDIFFFIFVIISALIVFKLEKDRNNNLIDNGIMSIGEIISRSSPTFGRINTRAPKLVYKFKVEDKIYEDVYFGKPPEGLKIGDRFLIFVNQDNYERTLILFDKPVNDSVDFERYKNQFNRKNSKWYKVNIKLNVAKKP